MKPLRLLDLSKTSGAPENCRKKQQQKDITAGTAIKVSCITAAGIVAKEAKDARVMQHLLEQQTLKNVNIIDDPSKPCGAQDMYWFIHTRPCKPRATLSSGMHRQIEIIPNNEEQYTRV